MTCFGQTVDLRQLHQRQRLPTIELAWPLFMRNGTRRDYRARMASLYAERDTALTRAIANLRQALGAERAHVFEAYLQNDFPSPVPKPARPKKRRSKGQSKEQSESTPSQ